MLVFMVNRDYKLLYCLLKICLKFLIQSVYDDLPSPVNLYNGSGRHTCMLTVQRGTLKHILSCCSKALEEQRYRWGHDQVHDQVFGDTISNLRVQEAACPPKYISFIRAGNKAPHRSSSGGGLLASVRDW